MWSLPAGREARTADSLCDSLASWALAACAGERWGDCQKRLSEQEVLCTPCCPSEAHSWRKASADWGIPKGWCCCPNDQHHLSSTKISCFCPAQVKALVFGVYASVQKILLCSLKSMQEFKRSCSIPQVHKYANCDLPLIHLLSQAMLITGLYLSNSPTDSGDDFLGLHVRSNLFQTSTICLVSHQQQASEMSDLSLTKAWILQNV